jgi:hypothetical protein
MTTTVALPRRISLWLRVGPPALGAVAGAALAVVAEWFADAIPGFEGVLGIGGHVGEPSGVLLGAGLGVLVGLVTAVAMLGECLRATVGPRSIVLVWDDARVSVPRRLITSVVADGDLVLYGPGGVELARVRCRLDRDQLRAALTRHGYPAPLAGDPYERDFRPWVPEAAGLGGPEHRLLAARAQALAGGARGDAELLRRRLAARGFMVRDVRGRRRRRVQEWRAVEALVEVPVAS